jgi:hypothetical protein
VKPLVRRLWAAYAICLDKGWDRRSKVGVMILDWDGDPTASADSLPLRLTGGLHALVLSGADAELSNVYPPHHEPADDEALWREVSRALTAHEAFLLDRLTSAPQTNEVRRSAAVLPALLFVAAEFQLPVVLSEVGASAGLNLALDQYAYELGHRRLGKPSSIVELKPEWRGTPLPDWPMPNVASRAGCDLNPLDASRPEDRQRLMSYLWPDQKDRLARTAAALDITRGLDVEVERADALVWLEHRLRLPMEGLVHVIFHTIAWQYLPKAARAKGDALVEEAGRRATPSAPLARIQVEQDAHRPGAGIFLQFWPGGEALKPVGRADFHGRWIDWHDV